MRTNIVGHRLEVLEHLLSLVNDALVLQHRTVVRKVNVGRLRLQRALDTLRVVVSLSEGVERCNRLWNYGKLSGFTRKACRYPSRALILSRLWQSPANRMRRLAR